MANYASFAAAREANGASYRLVLRVTLADNDTQAATNLNLLGDSGPILVLGSATDGIWAFDSGAGQVVEPAVVDWGTISASADCGSAFPSLGDIQILLLNRKLSGQLDNGSYTFSAGSAAMSPAPTGDEVRLSELLQHYTMTTLTVALFIESEGFGNDDTKRQEKVLFSGEVNGFTVSEDGLVIDATQVETIIDTTLPGREITDSPDYAASGSRAPIAYGTCTLSSTELNGLSPGDASACGVFIPLVPAVALSSSSGDTVYIYNDCAGPNTGWTTQKAWLTASDKSNINDLAYLVDAESMTYAILVEGTSTAQTEFIDGAATNAELTVKTYKYATANAYVRAIQVVAETGLTDDDNILEPNVRSYATLDVSSTDNYVHCLINPTKPMGDVVVEADCITGWVMLDNDSHTGSPEVDFGLWRPSASDWYAYGTGTVEGLLTGLEPSVKNLYDQKDENTADITAADYVGAGQGYLTSWTWKYPDDTASISNLDNIWIRVKVSTAGDAGPPNDHIRIISCGGRVKFYVVRGIDLNHMKILKRRR